MSQHCHAERHFDPQVLRQGQTDYLIPPCLLCHQPIKRTIIILAITDGTTIHAERCCTHIENAPAKATPENVRVKNSF
jgi:hypothetical protein